MKKILSLCLALLLLFTFVGCQVDAQRIETITSTIEDTLYTIDTDNSSIQDTYDTQDQNDIESIDSSVLSENDIYAGDVSVTEESEDTENALITSSNTEDVMLDEHGAYDSKEDVALFIHQYGHLPENYITKQEAQNLGWSGGSIEKYAPGKCIGGARFGNYEGLLPKASGRTYTECDIDTLGANSRGAKRIVFSNDGLIFYTEDHYNTFELLYGEIDE